VPGRRVAVTGIGTVTSIGSSTAAFAVALRQGKSGISSSSSLDPESFHSTLTGAVLDLDLRQRFSAHEQRRLDPITQLSLLACDEAVMMANLDKSDACLHRAAIVIGTTLGGMNSGLRFFRDRLRGRDSAITLRDFPLHAVNDHIATRWGMSGPSLVLSTACAASTHAIGMAMRMIRLGYVDCAITGGFDPFSELTHAGFGVLGLLTKDAVRPFDRNRSGLVLGEGAGFLFLEERNSALRRGRTILADLIGFGITSDAHHMTAPEASGDGAARAIKHALQDGGISASQIDYINAHGTGTRKNDLAEALAIRDVFGAAARRIPVSSTKSMIGHTLGAAGAIELIATILSMREGFLPPTINHRDTDPECDFDVVPNESRPAVIRTALSNSFGFGGNNGCIVVQRAEAA
jgi:3-oxoacyl-[acyl-carrier-protein] synthase II